MVAVFPIPVTPSVARLWRRGWSSGGSKTYFGMMPLLGPGEIVVTVAALFDLALSRLKFFAGVVVDE